MENVFEQIRAERKRQDEKWGISNHHPLVWNAILTEEVGEVSKECLNFTFDAKATEDMKSELIQVAAVAVAWIQALESTKDINKPSNP